MRMFYVAFTEAEYQLIKKAAKKCGKTIQEFLHDAVMEKVEKELRKEQTK